MHALLLCAQEPKGDSVGLPERTIKRLIRRDVIRLIYFSLEPEARDPFVGVPIVGPGAMRDEDEVCSRLTGV